MELRDIKPLVEIPDYSFFLYVAVITFVTVFVAAAIYWLIKVLSQKRAEKKEDYRKILQTMDLNDSKKVAYLITRYGKHLIKDSSALKIYEELLKRLAKYKYKKEVPPLDEETKRYIKLFLKMDQDG